MNEPLLTTDQLAALLQVAPKTLRNLRSRGKGPPAIKVGGAVRYKKADIDKWLTKNTQTTSNR